MNVALKKLALLEKNFLEQEEQQRIEGYVSEPINTELRKKVYALMEKVRAI